ncbi:amino acid permease [Tilletiaria anomala UBC 951]|uniref:Amino acid permease n=1 Tax=Tilletiaria anomala (strain ATCC 24038 / CBS 436.72 / UBC 951) TaxID=1037660 RepID=A0A066WF93_TILAU|nr:amino acid permease [Tilletiaria anomala UBC 951]KDN52436.1 amino acid permease [Tilletiaria anomala UBC 951]
MSQMRASDEKSDEKYASDGTTPKVDFNGYDPEATVSVGATNAFDQRNGEELSRKLKARHIAMISIGGVIGTGLFLGSGGALARSGPLALWLGYIAMGTICLSVMLSLGEMASFLPVPGGHIKLAARFVDPSFSAVMGWNYWYNWSIVLPAELSAAAVLIGYWAPDMNPAIWVAILLVLVVVINFLGAGAYGEAEFWFASIKVITIVGLIILSFLIDVGAVGDRLGFRYWIHPGPFNQYKGVPGAWGRFLSFWAVLIQAAFSFIGSEIVAIAAGEAKNPRRNIPRAIKSVYIRILLFYIVGTLAISVIVPYNDPRLLGGSTVRASPFVIAIDNAKIKVLPHIINAVLVTSATSAGSSDLYTSSRALYALALSGQAPRIFARTTKSGLPYVSLAIGTVCAFLSFMVATENAYTVFNYFANLTAVAGLSTWACICFTYLRFHAGMKVQGIDRSTLPFKSPLQPFLGWWGLCWSITCILFSGFSVFMKGHWDGATFITNYLTVPLFPLIYFGYKFVTKSKVVQLHEMDFVTGVKEIEAAEEEELPPRNFVEKFWRSLV